MANPATQCEAYERARIRSAAQDQEPTSIVNRLEKLEKEISEKHQDSKDKSKTVAYINENNYSGSQNGRKTSRFHRAADNENDSYKQQS